MGNQCNSKIKKKETSPLDHQKSNQNQNSVPLKFIIEIDKIKCKNLTNVK